MSLSGGRIINWVATLQHLKITLTMHCNDFLISHKAASSYYMANMSVEEGNGSWQLLYSQRISNQWVWHSVRSGNGLLLCSDSDRIKPLPQTSIFASLGITDNSTAQIKEKDTRGALEKHWSLISDLNSCSETKFGLLISIFSNNIGLETANRLSKNESLEL